MESCVYIIMYVYNGVRGRHMLPFFSLFASRLFLFSFLFFFAYIIKLDSSSSAAGPPFSVKWQRLHGSISSKQRYYIHFSFFSFGAAIIHLSSFDGVRVSTLYYLRLEQRWRINKLINPLCWYSPL